MSGPRIASLSLAISVACGPPGQNSTASAPDVGAAPTAAVPDAPAAPKPAAPAECADEPGMVYIPGGAHIYGIHKDTVQLPAFWIDRTEVTVAAFRAYVAAGFSAPYKKTRQRGYLVCTSDVPGGDELPVNCVDWYQATAFCKWAGKRLPTAAEWGWAAQGRDERRRFPWGDAPPSCDLAVVDTEDRDDVVGCGRNSPWPAGSKATDVTRDGVFDMMGNVHEWTASGDSDDPESTRIGMGGNWANNPGSRPVAELIRLTVHDSWTEKGGFRCARDRGPRPPCTAPR